MDANKREKIRIILYESMLFEAGFETSYKASSSCGISRGRIESIKYSDKSFIGLCLICKQLGIGRKEFLKIIKKISLEIWCE